MTKRFFIWLFWYVVGSIFIVTTDGLNNPGFIFGYALLALIILFSWWGTFLYKKYKDRGQIRYAVWGAFGLVIVIMLFGWIRIIFDF